MTHGHWSTRPAHDLFREFIVNAFVVALLIPAWHHKSVVTLTIVAAILIQHGNQLFGGDGVLSNQVILCGSFTLAVNGYWHHSLPIMLAGNFSFIGKFTFKWLVVFEHGWQLELFRLSLTLIVTAASYFYLLPYYKR